MCKDRQKFWSRSSYILYIYIYNTIYYIIYYIIYILYIYIYIQEKKNEKVNRKKCFIKTADFGNEYRIFDMP